jgi:hypothetical protein
MNEYILDMDGGIEAYNANISKTGSGRWYLRGRNIFSLGAGSWTVTGNGITMAGGTMTFNSNTSDLGVQFISNTHKGSGAALYVYAISSIAFNGGTNNILFANNRSTENPLGREGDFAKGGAIYNTYSTITFLNNASVRFVANMAIGENFDAQGGAINIYNATMTFINTTRANTLLFSQNQALNIVNASAMGGAIYLSSGAGLSFNVGQIIFELNTAQTNGASAESAGGAMYLLNNLAFSGAAAENLTFSSNAAISAGASANAKGGAVYISSSALNIGQGNLSFVSNSAQATNGVAGTVGGGAVYLDRSSISIAGTNARNVVFTSNAATGGAAAGGAIYTYLSTINFVGLAGTAGKISFIDNFSSGNGGGIYAIGSSVSFLNLGFLAMGNSGAAGGTSGSGGFAYLSQSIFTMTLNSAVNSNSAVFSSNTAADGGAIYMDNNSFAQITGAGTNSGVVEFSLNTAKSNSGGAISLDNSTMVFANINTVRFSSNVSGGNGGAIAMLYSSITFANAYSSFTGNTAANGGAINVRIGFVKFNNVNFTSNTATSMFALGGAIFAANSSIINITISANGSAIFGHNTSAGDAGAAYIGNSTLSFNTASGFAIVRFENNRAAGGSGGAIYLAANSSLSFVNISSIYFERNYAERNGTLYWESGALDFGPNANIIARQNVAGSSGAFIYFENKELAVGGVFTDISSNTAVSGSGGGLYITNSSIGFRAANVIFSSNYAGNMGGAIYAVGSTINFMGNVVSFTSNSANEGAVLFAVDGARINFIGVNTININYNVSRAVSGGGVLSWANGAAIDFSQANISAVGNEANNGGLFYFSGSEFSFGKGNFSATQNRARGLGGAIYGEKGSVVTLDTSEGAVNITFAENIMNTDTTPQANDIYLSSSQLIVQTHDFAGSVISIKGGMYGVFGSTITVSGAGLMSLSGYNYFSGNSSFDLQNGSKLLIVDSTFVFTGNSAFGMSATSTSFVRSSAVFAQNILDGGLYAFGGSTVTFLDTNVYFTGNKSFAGGGLAGSGGSIMVFTNSTVAFLNNTADASLPQTSGRSDAAGAGGALYVNGSSVTFVNSQIEFRGNKALTSSGAAIYLNDGVLTFNGGTILFEDNEAQRGIIAWIGGQINFGDAQIRAVRNYSKGNGGFLSIDQKTTQMGAAEFSSNTAGGSGGVLYLYLSQLTFTGEAVFSSNVAGANVGVGGVSSGGAVYLNASTLTFNRAVNFSQNVADYGGVILSAGNSSITFLGDIIISSNVSKLGNSVMELSNPSGPNPGTAIDLGAGHLTFTFNRAQNGTLFYLYSNNNSQILRNAGMDISSNVASGSGGVIYAFGSSVTIDTAGGAAIFSGNYMSNGALENDIFLTNNANLYLAANVNSIILRDGIYASGSNLYLRGSSSVILSGYNYFLNTSIYLLPKANMIVENATWTFIPPGQGGANIIDDIDGGLFSFTNSSVTIISASVSSAALHVINGGTISFVGGALTLVNNRGDRAGAINIGANSVVNISSIVKMLSITGNSANDASGSATGGAIYNAGILNIDAWISSVIFSNNSIAGAVANDIYITETGIMNLAGKNRIEFAGGISGTGTIVAQNLGDLSDADSGLHLSGGNGLFLGTFRALDSQVYVTSTYFVGISSIVNTTITFHGQAVMTKGDFGLYGYSLMELSLDTLAWDFTGTIRSELPDFTAGISSVASRIINYSKGFYRFDIDGSGYYGTYEQHNRGTTTFNGTMFNGKVILSSSYLILDQNVTLSQYSQMVTIGNAIIYIDADTDLRFKANTIFSGDSDGSIIKRGGGHVYLDGGMDTFVGVFYQTAGTTTQNGGAFFGGISSITTSELELGTNEVGENSYIPAGALIYLEQGSVLHITASTLTLSGDVFAASENVYIFKDFAHWGDQTLQRPGFLLIDSASSTYVSRFIQNSGTTTIMGMFNASSYSITNSLLEISTGAVDIMGDLWIEGNGRLVLSMGNDVKISSRVYVSNNSYVVKTGSGSVLFTANNSQFGGTYLHYQGLTQIAGRFGASSIAVTSGELRFMDGIAFSSAGIFLSAESSFSARVVYATNSIVLSSRIVGGNSSSIIKEGDGRLIFSGALGNLGKFEGLYEQRGGTVTVYGQYGASMTHIISGRLELSTGAMSLKDIRLSNGAGSSLFLTGNTDFTISGNIIGGANDTIDSFRAVAAGGAYLTITGDNSVFTGIFTMTRGTTTVTKDAKMFGGKNVVDSGVLIVSSANINYNVTLKGSNAQFIHFVTTGGWVDSKAGNWLGAENDTAHISSNYIKFDTINSGSLIFGADTSVKFGRYRLEDDLLNGVAGGVTGRISNSTVSFGKDGAEWTQNLTITRWTFDNTSFDLRNWSNAGATGQYNILGGTRTITFNSVTISSAGRTGYELSFGLIYNGPDDPDIQTSQFDLIADKLSATSVVAADTVFLSLGDIKIYFNDDPLYNLNIYDSNKPYISTVIANGANNRVQLNRYDTSVSTFVSGVYTYEVRILDNFAVRIDVRLTNAPFDELYDASTRTVGYNNYTIYNATGVYKTVMPFSIPVAGKQFTVVGESANQTIRIDAYFKRPYYDASVGAYTKRGTLFTVSNNNTDLTIKGLVISSALSTELPAFNQNGRGSVLRMINRNSKTTLEDLIIEANESSLEGGAVYAASGTLNIISNGYDTRFSTNIAGTSGGAIYIGGVSTTTFISALGKGVIFAYNASTNSALGGGGAIYAAGNSTTVFRGSAAFIGNRADNLRGGGGAIYAGGNAIVEFTPASGGVEASFINNHSASSGGAVYVGAGAQFIVRSSAVFTGNTASFGGGALYNAGTTTFDTTGNRGIIFDNNTSTVSNVKNDIENARYAVINFTGDGYTSISGGIAGEGIINKSGNGILILSGNDERYTGQFNMSGGDVYVSSNYFKGRSTISGGTITFRSDSALVGAENNLIVNDTGKIILEVSGGFILGYRYLGGNGTLVNNMGAGKDLVFNDDNRYFTGTLIQNAGRTVIYSYMNASSIAVNGGGLVEFGTASVNVAVTGGIFLQDTGRVLINNGASNLVISSVIAGDINTEIEKKSSGLLTLTENANASSFTGRFIQSAGNVTVSGGFGASSIAVINAGSILKFSPAANGMLNKIDGLTYLSAGAKLSIDLTNGNLTMSSSIFGGAREIIEKTGAFTLILSSDNETFSGWFNQTGGTTTVNGKFFVGNSTINAAILDFGAGAGNIDSGEITLLRSATINIDELAGDMIFNTKITGTSADTIYKASKHHLTLAGNLEQFLGRFIQSGGTTTVLTKFNPSSASISASVLELSSNVFEFGGAAYLYNNGNILISGNTNLILSARLNSLPLGNAGNESIIKISAMDLVFTNNNSSFTGRFVQSAGTTTIIGNTNANFGNFFGASSISVNMSKLIISSANRRAMMAGNIYLENGAVLEINGFGDDLRLFGKIVSDGGDDELIIKTSTKALTIAGDASGFTGRFIQEGGPAGAVAVTTITGAFGASSIAVNGNSRLNLIAGIGAGLLQEIKGDIYLDRANGSAGIYINTAQSGTVNTILTMSAKIYGNLAAHTIVKAGVGELILNGDFNDFAGWYIQNGGTTTVRGKYFVGTSSINGNIVNGSALRITGLGNIESGKIEFTYAKGPALLWIDNASTLDITFTGNLLAGIDEPKPAKIRVTIEKDSEHLFRLTGDNSLYRGIFIQSAGTTTINNLFGASSISINNSVLELSTGAKEIMGDIYLGNNAVLLISGNDNLTISSRVFDMPLGLYSDNRLIHKISTTTLIFTNNNSSFTGRFVAEAGRTIISPITLKEKAYFFSASSIAVRNGSILEISTIAAVKSASMGGIIYLTEMSTLSITGDSGELQMNGSVVSQSDTELIIKDGKKMLTFNGDNSKFNAHFIQNAGTTTITGLFGASTISINNDSALILRSSPTTGGLQRLTSMIILSNTAKMQINTAAGNLTVGKISGTVDTSILKQGANGLILEGDGGDFKGWFNMTAGSATALSSYFNGISSITASRLILLNSANVDMTSIINLANGGNILIAGSGNLNLDGTITGTVKEYIEKTASTNLTLKGHLNEFTGRYIQSAGTTTISGVFFVSSISASHSQINFTSGAQKTVANIFLIDGGNLLIDGNDDFEISSRVYSLPLGSQNSLILKASTMTLYMTHDNSSFTGRFVQTAGKTIIGGNPADTKVKVIGFGASSISVENGSLLEISSRIANIAGNMFLIGGSTVSFAQWGVDLAFGGNTEGDINESIIKNSGALLRITGDASKYFGVFAQNAGTTTISNAFSASSIAVNSGALEFISESGRLVRTDGIIYINNARLVSNNVSADLEISSQIFGNGVIEKRGNFGLLLSSNNANFTGWFNSLAGTVTVTGHYFDAVSTINASQLRFLETNVVLGSKEISLVGGGNILFENTADLTVVNKITGNENEKIEKKSDTTLIFSGDVASGFKGLFIQDSGTTTVLNGTFAASSVSIRYGRLELGDNSAMATNGNVYLENNGSNLLINNSAAMTIAGAISGVANSTITKAGSGGLTLTGDNTNFTGFFVQNAGNTLITNMFEASSIAVNNATVLELRNDTGVGAAEIKTPNGIYINGGSTLLLSANTKELIISARIYGGFSDIIKKTANNNLTLSGDNSGFNGQLVLQSGRTTISNEIGASSIAVENTILNINGVGKIVGNIYNFGTINISATKDIEISSSIFGNTSAVIAKTGTYSLVLSSDNETYAGNFTQNAGTTVVRGRFFSGETTISQSTLIFAGANSKGGSGNIIINGGSWMRIFDDAGDVLFSGNISGENSAYILKSNANRAIFAGNNGQYLGAYIQDAGTTVVRGAAFNASSIAINSGQLEISTRAAAGNITITGPIFLRANAGVFVNNDINDSSSYQINIMNEIAGDDTTYLYVNTNNAATLMLNANNANFRGRFVQMSGNTQLNDIVNFSSISVSGGNLIFAGPNSSISTNVYLNGGNLQINVNGDFTLEDRKIYNANPSGAANAESITKGSSGLLTITTNTEFTGNYNQNAGTTTVGAGGVMFGGINYLNTSLLRVSSSSYYYKVVLNQGGALEHFATTLSTIAISKTAQASPNVGYLTMNAGALSATFGSTIAAGAKANYHLADDVASAGGRVIFNNAAVTFGSAYSTTQNLTETYAGNYSFVDSTIDLRSFAGGKESLGSTRTFEFSPITLTGTNNKLSVGIYVYQTGVDVFNFALDTLNSNTGGTLIFGDLRLYFSDGTLGITPQTYTGVTILGPSGSLALRSGASASIEGSAFRYTLTRNSNNGKLVDILVEPITLGYDPLYDQNSTGGNRYYSLYPASSTYKISRSLSITSTGYFRVFGEKGAGDDIDPSSRTLDGTYRRIITEGEERGSFFKLWGDTSGGNATTRLEVYMLTISSAYIKNYLEWIEVKNTSITVNGNGSVLSILNANSSATFSDVRIMSNDAALSGGAFYISSGALYIVSTNTAHMMNENWFTRISSNSAMNNGGAAYVGIEGSMTFISGGGNTIAVEYNKGGLGGAVYNEGSLKLIAASNGKIIFSSNTAGYANDIYNTVSGSITVGGDNSGIIMLNSGLAGTGTVNVTASRFVLGGDSSRFGGVFNQSGGTVVFTNAYFGSGIYNVSGGTVEFAQGMSAGANSGNMFIDANGTLLVSADIGTITFAGVDAITSKISGAGVIEKRGTGAFEISGNNALFTGHYVQNGGKTIMRGSWTATTDINSGIFEIADWTLAQGQTIIYNSGISLNAASARLLVSAANDIKINSIKGVGSKIPDQDANAIFEKTGSGVLTLTGDSSGFFGTAYLSNGRTIVENKFFTTADITMSGTAELIFSTGTILTNGWGVVLSGQARLIITTYDDLAFNGAIKSGSAGSANSGIYKYSTGTLTLTGDNGGFAGNFYQTAGKTVFNDQYFSGLNIINNSELIVNSAGDTINYGVNIGNLGALIHIQTGSYTSPVRIANSDRFRFTGTDGRMVFTTNDISSRAIYQLFNDVAIGGTVEFSTVNVMFGNIQNPTSMFSINAQQYVFNNTNFDLSSIAGGRAGKGDIRTIVINGLSAANVINDGYVNKLAFGFYYNQNTDSMTADKLQTNPMSTQIGLDVYGAKIYFDDNLDGLDGRIYELPILNAGGYFEFLPTVSYSFNGSKYSYLITYLNQWTLKVELTERSGDPLYLANIDETSDNRNYAIDYSTHYASVLYSSPTYKTFSVYGTSNGGDPALNTIWGQFQTARPGRLTRTSLFYLNSDDNVFTLHNVTISLAYINSTSTEAWKIQDNFGNGSILRIAKAGAKANIYDVIFINNEAGTDGGTIWATSGTLTVESRYYNTRFANNTAGTSGGAIYLANTTAAFMTMAGSTVSMDFVNNNANRGYGGAIFVKTSTVAFVGNINFSGNRIPVGLSGGAIYAGDQSSITFMGNIKFLNNVASGNGGGGGALYIANGAKVYLIPTAAEMVFDNNRALNGNGGALYNAGELDITLNNNVVFSNNYTGQRLDAADNKPNDIHNIGVINIYGTADILLSGGITGSNAGKINFNSSGEMILSGGDSSGYKGEFHLNTGKAIVGGTGAGGQYFTGNTFMKAGTSLEFIGNAEIVGGTITFEGGSTITINALTIKDWNMTEVNGIVGGGLFEKFNAKSISFTTHTDLFVGTYTQTAGRTIIGGKFGASSITVLGQSIFELADNSALTGLDNKPNLYLINGSTLVLSMSDQQIILNAKIVSDADSFIHKTGAGFIELGGVSNDFVGIFSQEAGTASIKNTINSAKNIMLNDSVLEIDVSGSWSNPKVNTIELRDYSKLIIEKGDNTNTLSISSSNLATSLSSASIMGAIGSSITKTSALHLSLNGNGDQYFGTFNQTAGTTTVNGRYFRGISNISQSRLELSSGSVLVAGNTYLTSGGNIIITDNNNELEISGQLISDESAVIEKINAARTVFSGDNTGYSGGVIQRAGDIEIKNNFGTMLSTITNLAGNLILSAPSIINSKIEVENQMIINVAGGEVVLNNNITGTITGKINVTGPATVARFNGDNTGFLGTYTQSGLLVIFEEDSKFFGGNSELSGDAQLLFADNSSFVSGTLALNDNSLLSVNTDYIVNITNGKITSGVNTSSVVKNGSGSLIISGDESGFTGTFRQNDGTTRFIDEPNTKYFANASQNIINGGRLELSAPLIIGASFKSETSDGIIYANSNITLSGNNGDFRGEFILNNSSATIIGGTYFGATTRLTDNSTVSFRGEFNNVAAAFIGDNGTIEANGLPAHLTLTGDNNNFFGKYAAVNNGTITFANGLTKVSASNILGDGTINIDRTRFEIGEGNNSVFIGTISVNNAGVLALDNANLDKATVVIGPNSTLSTVNNKGSVSMFDVLTISGTWISEINVVQNYADKIEANNIIINDATAKLNIEFFGRTDRGLQEDVLIMSAAAGGSIFGNFQSAEAVSLGVKYVYKSTITLSNEMWLVVNGKLMNTNEIESYFGSKVGNLSHNEKVMLDRINKAVRLYNDSIPQRTSASGSGSAAMAGNSNDAFAMSSSLDDPYYQSLAERVQREFFNRLGNGGPDAVKEFLNSLAGSFYANIIPAGALTANIDSLYERINRPSKENKEPWIEFNYNAMPKKGDDNSMGDISNNGYGVSAGMDLYENTLFNGDINAGAFLGAEKRNMKQNSDKADITALELGLFGGWFYKDTTVKTIFSVGQQSFDVNREIDVDGIMTFKSNFETQSLKFAIEAAQKLITINVSEKLNGDVKVFAGMNIGYVSNGEIHEKTVAGDDGLAVMIYKDAYMRVNGRAGLQIDNILSGGQTRWYGKMFMNALVEGDRAQYEVADTDDVIYGAQEMNRTFGAAAGVSQSLSNALSLNIDAAINANNKMGYALTFGASYKF